MDPKFRSRKWLLTMFVQVSATAAFFAQSWTGAALTGADFAIISSANVAQYGFSNAAQYFAERKQ